MGGMRTLLLALCAMWVGGSLAYAGEIASIDAICRSGLSSPCVTRVGASLRSERSGAPLPGRKLSIVSGHVVICSSLTKESGIASCYGVAPSAVALTTSGYRVLFEGDGVYEATNAAGGAVVLTQAADFRRRRH